MDDRSARCRSSGGARVFLGVARLLAVLVAWEGHCRAGVIARTDFEPAEGYVAGVSLIGQNGWTGISPITPEAAGVGIDAVLYPALGQFGFIGGFKVPVSGVDDSGDAEPKQTVGRAVSFTPGAATGNKVIVTMVVVPYNDNPMSFDQFGITLLNSEQSPLCTVALSSFGSGLIVVDQLDEATASAPGIPYVSGVQYEVRFELDFAANTWSAWFGGQAAAINRRLYVPYMATDLGSVTFTWGRYTFFPDGSENHYLVFDRLKVETPQVATVDTRLLIEPVAGGGDMDVTIRAPGGSTGLLQFASSPAGAWTDLATVEVPAGGSLVFRHQGARSQPRGFYRFAVASGG